MTQQTQAYLVGRFQTDDEPDGTDFADLIDSLGFGLSKPYIDVTVAASGGDYTSITAALAGITDATASKKYRILVKPGSYSDNQIACKEHVDIESASSDLVTITGAGTTGQSLIESIKPNCTISGLTLVMPSGGRYVLHADQPGVGTFTMRDCVLVQQSTGNDAIGYGGRAGQTVQIEDCAVLGSIGIHGSDVTRSLDYGWNIRLIGVQATTVNLRDTIEYLDNIVDLAGCSIDLLTYTLDTSFYTANAGNVLYNRGFQQESIKVRDWGNKIGRASVIANAVKTSPFVLPSITKLLTNSGGSTIPAGYAATLQSDGTVQLWAGSGVFAGVAVASIAASAAGVVQFAGEPLVFANGGTAIVYGDAMELNSSGQGVKQASGRLRGDWRGALASGTGLVAAKLV